MMTFIPITKDMQALADLQQVVANLRAYLGLAPVASTLPSFPHGATSSPTASSPLPRAASDSRRVTRDAGRKLPLNVAACSYAGEGGSDEEEGASHTEIEEEKEAEDHLAAHGEAYLEQTGEATKVLTSCKELLPPPTDVGAKDQGKEDGDKDAALPMAVVAPDKVGGSSEGAEDGPKCVGHRFPAQGGAADRRGQHVVFFLGSGGMAVAGREKSRVVGGDHEQTRPEPLARGKTVVSRVTWWRQFVA
ncbi:hypothetical protein GUJ93_ZPchr0001g30376 [Zizania palustris]|uniref:Uncharacterized protein n=1 Tax=Zizania palustris TaxID=103762 RepID=A0A8J5RW00_ZIZPA|nr:hypothetical protein GUJ93_ZPchr0001g30376 [Zizania palustris]